MRARHRQPTLVSMWMLDVFCCALGCMTLLWLLNTREAKMRSISLGETTSVLAKTKNDLIELTSKTEQEAIHYRALLRDLEADKLALIQDRDELAKRLALARTDLETTGQRLALTEDIANQLSLSLELSDAENRDIISRLAKRQTDLDDVTKQMNAGQTQVVTLEKLLRDKNLMITDAAKRAATMREQLDDLEKKFLAMTKEKTTLEELLKRSNITIVDLKTDQTKLNDRISKLQAERDTRFAGIALTGKRVVFLVDTSGSMDRLNYETPVPTKWPLVRETVARVMQSLPEMEQFQVITFAKEMTYLLGSDGEWIRYEGAASIDRVKKALAAIEPKEDTNLYQPLEAAFKLRSKGLDTIYLFSDGLPSKGPGFTAEQEAALAQKKELTDDQKIQERSRLLGNHLLNELRTTMNPRGATQIRINTIGFFYESPDLGAFLWSLARDNDGSFVGMSKP